MSSGSDGLYLSPLSDLSPATSDCLEPYFSGGFYFIFQLSRVLTFLGPFISANFLDSGTGFWEFNYAGEACEARVY